MKKTILFLIAFSFISFSQQNFWKRTNGPYGGDINSLAINSKGFIFAGTVGGGLGAFRSTDSGAFWQGINNGLNTQYANNVTSLVINSNDCILAGTYEGTFKSTDDGENWVNVNDTLYPLAANSIGYFFARSGPSNLGASSGKSVYRSTDNGISWTEINNGLPDPVGFTFMAINQKIKYSLAAARSCGYPLTMEIVGPN